MPLGREAPSNQLALKDGGGRPQVYSAAIDQGVQEKDAVVLKRRRSTLDSAFALLLSLSVGIATSVASIKKVIPDIATSLHSIENVVIFALALSLAAGFVSLALGNILGSWRRLKTNMGSANEFRKSDDSK
jgi:uncharacterized membrane protein YqgA involved in biofilm formation